MYSFFRPLSKRVCWSLPVRAMHCLRHSPVSTPIRHATRFPFLSCRSLNTPSAVASRKDLINVFKSLKSQSRPAFVAYLTAGYPDFEKSVESVKVLAENGADIIELGVPFTDPLADGPVIQHANQVALDSGIRSVQNVLEIARRAREEGVTTPFVLMGYYNPFYHYKSDKGLMVDCKEAGISGFIIVDLPPEEAIRFRDNARKHDLSFIPLLAPTTTPARISTLVNCADSFVYAVSLLGVTGARTKVSDELPAFVERIRNENEDIPIAIGFGVSDRDQFIKMAKLGGDGIVVGSAIVSTIKDNPEDYQNQLKIFCQNLIPTEEILQEKKDQKDAVSKKTTDVEGPSDASMFGEYGGKYVPETLIYALDELETEYNKLKHDPEFIAEIESYYPYIGRPSSLHMASRLTEYAGGANIWLKREDLNHTGAHKINNAISQALLAKRIGKTRIIAETGAGQHGVATATVCAKLNLPLVVYMGADDVRRQALNVFRMEMLGAQVVGVDSGSRTLKDAINEAMRDWVTNIKTTHYLVGSAIGPHPFPTIVRDFQKVIGEEAREQMLAQVGALPDAVIACVGGGSNAIGIFHPFIDDTSVKLVGVEAAGNGIDSGLHSAPLHSGTPGVLHGTRTYLLQDKAGQINETHSISAGLDYPGVGPEHSHLRDIKRVEYRPVNDHDALLGFKHMTQFEGIIPALETSHAIYGAIELAKEMGPGKNIIICMSGRGDKDVDSVRSALPKFGCKLRMRSQADL